MSTLAGEPLIFDHSLTENVIDAAEDLRSSDRAPGCLDRWSRTVLGVQPRSPVWALHDEARGERLGAPSRSSRGVREASDHGRPPTWR